MIKNRAVILGLLTGLNFLNYIDRMVLAAVLDDVQKELVLSNFEAGLLATAFLVGYFVTAPFFGSRADRGSRKGLIAFGVLVWSAATIATGFAHSLGAMLAARVFVGIGEASYATLAPTIIDDLTPPDRKNRALAIFYLAIPLGSAIGYMLGGTIDKHFGWNAAFFIAGGPGVVLALSCLAIAEPAHKVREAKAKVFDSISELVRIPIYRRAVLGYCAYTGALGAFSYWAPKFLIHNFHELDTQTANFWFGLITVISGAIGTIIGGRWADSTQRSLPPVTGDTPYDAPANRAGSNALLRVCAIGMVAAAPLGALCFFMPTATGFFVVAFACEIGLFLSTSPVNAVGLRAVPIELRASAMAAMIFAVHLLGDLWSPPVLGWLQDVMPPVLAMMALPLTFALSAYVWWPRKREAA